MSYPGNIKDCAKGPAKGGLPVGELRKLATSMGLNIKGLKKGEICALLEQTLGAPAQVPETIPVPVTKAKPSRGCVVQSQQKYQGRSSPPYPANECCGEIMAGNDGMTYESRMTKGGYCRWFKVAAPVATVATKAPKPSPISSGLASQRASIQEGLLSSMEELLEGASNMHGGDDELMMLGIQTNKIEGNLAQAISHIDNYTKDQVRKMSAEDIKFYTKLLKMVKDEKIRLVDSESMVPLTAMQATLGSDGNLYLTSWS